MTLTDILYITMFLYSWDTKSSELVNIILGIIRECNFRFISLRPRIKGHLIAYTIRMHTMLLNPLVFTDAELFIVFQRCRRCQHVFFSSGIKAFFVWDRSKTYYLFCLGLITCIVYFLHSLSKVGTLDDNGRCISTTLFTVFLTKIKIDLL